MCAEFLIVNLSFDFTIFLLVFVSTIYFLLFLKCGLFVFKPENQCAR